MALRKLRPLPSLHALPWMSGPEKRNVLKSIGLFPDRFRAVTGGRAGGS